MTERMTFDADLMKKQRDEQSSELTQFYREYYTKALDPATDNHAFYPDTDLCRIALTWASYYGCCQILIELRTQFKYAGLGVTFPFGEALYTQHLSNRTMHKDQNRLEWVRLHIPELNK